MSSSTAAGSRRAAGALAACTCSIRSARSAQVRRRSCSSSDGRSCGHRSSAGTEWQRRGEADLPRDGAVVAVNRLQRQRPSHAVALAQHDKARLAVGGSCGCCGSASGSALSSHASTLLQYGSGFGCGQAGRRMYGSQQWCQWVEQRAGRACWN